MSAGKAVVGVFLLALLLFGCVPNVDKDSWPAALKKENAMMVPTIARRLVFFKHPESGLCFGYAMFDRSHAITTVPCEKVQKLLVNP